MRLRLGILPQWSKPVIAQLSGYQLRVDTNLLPDKNAFLLQSTTGYTHGSVCRLVLVGAHFVKLLHAQNTSGSSFAQDDPHQLFLMLGPDHGLNLSFGPWLSNASSGTRSGRLPFGSGHFQMPYIGEESPIC